MIKNKDNRIDVLNEDNDDDNNNTMMKKNNYIDVSDNDYGDNDDDDNDYEIIDFLTRPNIKEITRSQ